jgi:hypothetical protein
MGRVYDRQRRRVWIKMGEFLTNLDARVENDYLLDSFEASSLVNTQQQQPILRAVEVQTDEPVHLPPPSSVAVDSSFDDALSSRLPPLPRPPPNIAASADGRLSPRALRRALSSGLGLLTALDDSVRQYSEVFALIPRSCSCNPLARRKRLPRRSKRLCR